MTTVVQTELLESVVARFLFRQFATVPCKILLQLLVVFPELLLFSAGLFYRMLGGWTDV
jgi:hypothetical protein